MKRFVWIGSIIFTLSLAACGAAQPTDDANSQAPAQEAAAENSGAEVAEAVSDSPQKQADEDVENSEAPAADQEEAAADNEADTAEAASAHESSATCDDPFAGVEGLRISPAVWTAEAIARYVSPEIVDPQSGLATNFCLHSVDYAELLSGGPPPDGIPPLDNPSFESIAAGDEWLADVQPVIAVNVGDESKAYPLAILTWHEIANDTVGGMPVAVTFCPLCNAAVVFNRELDGETLRLGVSGNLRNSDMIMWDNKTLSWWQQFTGEGIVGDSTGAQLEMIPAQLVAWKDYKAANPDGQVMSRETGANRAYGRNPYDGYDSTESPFLFLGTPDSRLPATQRVLGYFKGDTAVAYPLDTIAEEKVIEDTIDGQDVVVFFEPGQVSALDQSAIENSKEVGSAGMFIPEVDGQKLTFSYNDGVITDNETGSEWDIFGRAVSGELEGAQLDPVLSHMHFWFAWAAFKENTRIYGS